MSNAVSVILIFTPSALQMLATISHVFIFFIFFI